MRDLYGGGGNEALYNFQYDHHWCNTVCADPAFPPLTIQYNFLCSCWGKSEAKYIKVLLKSARAADITLRWRHPTTISGLLDVYTGQTLPVHSMHKIC